jgi:hypothetical protein
VGLYIGTICAQNPPMHDSDLSQHCDADVQVSSVLEQRGCCGWPHVPFVQYPLQQSTPVVQL